MRAERFRGFTLVELLVVIAIISLVIVMVSSSLQSARVAARRSACASNMRQIGLAVLSYAADHGGRFPPTRHSAAHEEAWIFLLAPYLGEVDAVRISPADPNGRERLQRRSTSYLLNDVVVDPLTDPFGDPLPGGYGRLDRIIAPAATLLAAVIDDTPHCLHWSAWWSKSIVRADPRHRHSGSASTTILTRFWTLTPSATSPATASCAPSSGRSSTSSSTAAT
jgi:prepilin-type N-terminal cleavage/methylation domain-containing protein